MARYAHSQYRSGYTAKFHKAIDLGNLVPQLDKTAADVVENQKDALVQRKELAQKTKDYRKLDDSEKLTEWKGLLKGMEAAWDLR